MISRTAAKAIADAYKKRFVSTSYHSAGPSISRVDRAGLYDFLFVHNFDAWICNSTKYLRSDNRSVQEYVMQLHTGESVATATPKWTWPQRQTLGQSLLKQLAECLIKERLTNPEFERYGDSDKKAVDAMRSALELEGYIYKDGTLYVPEESVLQEPEEQGLLVAMMTELGLQDIETLKHHLDLSATHYQDEKWDDSIGNSRKVLEGVLRQVALRTGGRKGTPALTEEELDRPAKVREHLESCGILEKKEKDTLSQVYGLLSETGGHPYVAQKDQARLMRHLSLTFCQFVLLRLRGSLDGASGK